MKVAADSMAASGHGFAAVISGRIPEFKNSAFETSLIVVITFAPAGVWYVVCYAHTTKGSAVAEWGNWESKLVAPGLPGQCRSQCVP